VKNLTTIAILLFSFAAHANHECAVTIFTRGKSSSETKIDWKQDKKDKNLVSAEKDGYIFELLHNEKDPNQIQKLIVREKASTRRSISSFSGLKAEGPNALFMTALVDESVGPNQQAGARITCKLIK
jgi:hypothetical protein